MFLGGIKVKMTVLLASVGLFQALPAFADDLDQPIQVFESVDLRSDVNLGIQTTYEQRSSDSEALEHQKYINAMLPYEFSSVSKQSAPPTVAGPEKDIAQ